MNTPVVCVIGAVGSVAIGVTMALVIRDRRTLVAATSAGALTWTCFVWWIAWMVS